MLVKIKFAAEDNLAGGVFFGYPGGRWETVSPKYSKVDKVDFGGGGCCKGGLT